MQIDQTKIDFKGIDMENIDDYNIFIFTLIDKQNKIDYISKYNNNKLRKEYNLQRHHIYPRHTYKLYKKKNEEHPFPIELDDPQNIVICTVEDHAEAHRIRFIVYKDYYDLSAYHGLKNNTVEKNSARSKAINDTHRKNKTGFFNSELQRELSLRPKKLYFLKQNPNLAKEYSILARGISKKTSERAAENYLERGKYVGRQPSTLDQRVG